MRQGLARTLQLVLLLLVLPRITLAAQLTGTDTGAVLIAMGGNDISGRVFEDADFAGSATDYAGGAGDKALQGVDVELYDAGTDVFIASANSDVTGSYLFAGLADGNYKVRARSATIGDPGTTPMGGLNASVPATWPYPLAEMTWGNGATMYGGQDPAVDDTATADDAGPGDTYVTVTVSGANVTNVNLGFAYNLIVNTGGDSTADNVRSVQGSLRQFIKNANAIGIAGGTTANASEFLILASDPNYNAGTGVFTIAPPILLPALADAGTILDASTQGDNAAETNPGNLGVGGKVGVDQLDLSTVPAPEVEIAGSGTLINGIRITADNVTLRGLSIYGFNQTNSGNGGIHVANGVTGALIEQNVIGSRAAAFANPGAGLRNWENVYSDGGDGGTLRNNLIGFGGVRGVLLAANSNNWIIEDNEFRDNSLDSPFGDGIAVDPGSATVTGNLVVGSASQGIVVNSAAGSTLVNNTISGNGVGITTASGAAAGMTIRPAATAMTVDRNEFTANYAAGVSVNNGATGIRITRNAFSDNGTIVARNGDPATGQIGIDLNNPSDASSAGTPPYVSLNDPGDTVPGGNTLLNYPVLDTAQIVGPNLELSGWAAPGTVIELFLRDTDGSLFGEGLTYATTMTEGGTGAGGEDPYVDLDASSGSYGPAAINGIVQGSDTTNRFRFSFPLPAGVSSGTELTASARDGSNNTSEFSGRVVVSVVLADLTLTKTDAPDPAPAGGALVYTLLVVNNGLGAATAVTVTDVLPASVTLVSATPSQGSCSGTTTVTCDLGTILNSGTGSVEILVTTSGTGAITNNASVTANESDPVPADNSAAENTDVVNSPISDVPLTQYRRIHGFLDHAVTGGSLRTDSNSGDPCAVGPNSTGTLAGIPGTATVTHAFLYWAGSGSTIDSQVTLDGVALTADRSFQAQFILGATSYDFFGGFEDVTAQIAAKGNGSYTFEDLTVDTANPYCAAKGVLAGWSLIVVYEDSALTGKTLLLYDGFDLERNSSTSYLLTGLWAADPPEAKTTFLVWEGDDELGGVGERLEFNAVTQSDGLNPADNVYNSTINSLPSSTTYGLDADSFDVSGEITAGDTLATLGMFTGPDLVILNAAVLQVKSNIITGYVFEDVNYGGGAGRNRVTAAAAAPAFSVERPAAVVELYDALGDFVKATTTDVNGSYGFAGLIDGDYTVRIVNESVDSSRAGATGSEWPVQTFRTNASSGTTVAVTNEIGGADPLAQDDPANLSNANLSTLAAQSIAPARIVTGITVADVDFGYNFDTIVNSNDSGQGALRQLILNANSLTDDASLAQSGLGAGAETSIFMLPVTDPGHNAGTNSFLIQLTSAALPLSTDSLVLDGTTQPGYDGSPGIDLDGGLLVGPNLHGFESDQNDQTVRGFVIRNFSGTGIRLFASDGHTIQANYIGTDVDGTTAQPNQVGVSLESGADNSLIGGPAGGDRNIVAFNLDDGIRVDGVTGVTVLANNLFGNGGLGIDLLGGSENPAGVTANDNGDGDTGSNDLLNFPVIISAVENAGTVSVDFRLDLPAGDYRIEFFINTSGGDPSGNGEGEVFTSFVPVNHTGSGPENFSDSFPAVAGDVIAATTTVCSNGAVCSSFGSTSEFSAVFSVSPRPSIVKRAFQPDGTPIASGSTLPEGILFRFLLYISNPGGPVTDVSLQDALDPVFDYIPGSIKYDNSIANCAAPVCTPLEEAAIFAAVDSAATRTDAVDGDVASFAGITIDIGNQSVANAQLDLAGGRVWAVVFTVRTQ